MRWAMYGLVCLAAARAMALDPAKAMDQYVYRHWGTAEGFVGGAIYSIAQSPDGFLWIGTDRGLVRFDGSAFTLIQRPIPGQVPLGRVRGLIADSNGTLWIRTEGAHLLLYRDGIFRDAFAAFNIEEATYTAMARGTEGSILLTGLGSSVVQSGQNGLRTIANAIDVPGTITALAASRDTSLWIGTRDGGLFLLKDGHFISGSSQLESSKINALLAAHNGGIWIGTDHGIRLRMLDGSLQPQPPGIAAASQILALSDDNHGNLWAGSNAGLIRIALNGQESLLAGSGSITAIFEDREGNLWFGGQNGLECLFDGAFTLYQQPARLHGGRSGPVYADGHGRIWFAPMSGGLRLLENGHIRKIDAEGLNRDVVYSIHGDGDTVWIGRQHGGLTRIDTAKNAFTTRTFTRADGLAENSVYSVRGDSRGKVWAGTLSGGLSVFDHGIFHNYTSANGLSSNAINSITFDHDGAAWIATPQGLDEFRAKRWRSWRQADGLPSSDVRTCLADSDGVLWVATSDGLAYIRAGRVTALRALPDVLREQILDIAEDRFGYLWFATTDHLLRAPRSALLAGSLHEADLQSFGASDGLAGASGLRRDHSMASDVDGKIWIAVDNGVAVADPAPNLRSMIATPVLIESLLSGGKSYPTQGALVLPAGSYDLTIRFAANMLTAPDRVRYRYKLDGMDSDWSQPVSAHEIRYSNLAPGKYLFHVVASRDGTLWNAPESALHFSIARAYWQTWWFRIATLVSSVLLVIFILRLRTLALARQWNERFQERLKERTRIAQELHDTLLQSFQGLMLRFQTVDMLLPDRPADAKEALDAALDRADKAIRESRAAIEGIREPSSRGLDPVAMLRAALREIGDNYAHLGEQLPESTVIVEGAPRLLTASVSIDIDRIAREAIRNCFEHGRAHRIEAEIGFSRSGLRLSIRDDGIGIDPAILSKGAREGHWGLTGMRERADRLRARIHIWSKPGVGTEIELSVPAQIAFQYPQSVTRPLAPPSHGGNHDEEP